MIEQITKSSILFNKSAFTVQVINGDNPFFTSLKESSKGNKDDIEVQIGSELQNLHKPVLRIIPVHTLKNASDETVPYLEYQFKARINSSLDKPVSNTSKVVHVEVMIDGGYSETIEKSVDIAKSVSGFVIQQSLSRCRYRPHMIGDLGGRQKRFPQNGAKKAGENAHRGRNAPFLPQRTWTVAVALAVAE